MDSDAPCRFFRRIGFHLCYTSITYVCQAQNQRNDAGTECPACTAKKSISILIQIDKGPVGLSRMSVRRSVYTEGSR